MDTRQDTTQDTTAAILSPESETEHEHELDEQAPLIARVRAKLGLSQPALADLIGVSRRTVIRCEAGRAVPRSAAILLAGLDLVPGDRIRISGRMVAASRWHRVTPAKLWRAIFAHGPNPQEPL